MKRLLPLLLIFGFLPFLSPAQETGYRLVQTTFLPREFYVGDIVELRVEIQPDPGKVLRVPDSFPENTWMLIREIRIQERGEYREISILFSSYQPGIRMMPPLNLGDITLEGLRVDTSSLLSRQRYDFMAATEPMFLPKTALYFALLVGGVLGIPLLALLFFRGLRNRIAAAVRAARRKRPFLRIQRALKELDRKILNRDGNQFYTTLLGELKTYLTQRSGVSFASLTTRETSAVLIGLYPEETFPAELDELFRYGDQVKFGGLDPYTSRKKEDLGRTGEILQALEVHYSRLWMIQDRRRAR